MALTYSVPGVSGLASTTDFRKAVAGLIVKDTAGVARHGVFPAHGNPIVTARGDMNVDVGAFQAAAVQFGGPVLFSNDGPAQLPSVLVSPVSGTNWYVVYAKQNESTSPGTDADTNRVLGVTLSTASFAAARALLPTGAVELATVQMPTGKTATNQSGVTITQTFQYTATEGGVVLLRNQTEQTAWAPHDGSLGYRTDTGLYVERVGGVWVARGGSVSVRTNVAHTTSGATFTPLPVLWNLEDYDTDDFHSTSSNTSRLTAPAKGLYEVTAKLWYGSGAFSGGVVLGKNGVVDEASRVIQPPWSAAGVGSFPQTSRTFQLAAGDYIEVFSTAEAASMGLNVAQCFAEMRRVG